MTLKTISLSFIFCLLFLGSGYYYAYTVYLPEKVEHYILQNVASLGFETFEVDNKLRGKGSITFSDVKIDPDSFSRISNIKVKYSLLSFLLNNKTIDEIEINGLQLTGDLDENYTIKISGFNRNHNFIKNIKDFPAHKITIKNSRITLLTAMLGGVNLSVEGHILRTEKKSALKFHIDTLQKNLNFYAKLDGIISNEGVFTSNIDMESLSLQRDRWHFRRGTADIKLRKAPLSPMIIMADAKFPSVELKGLPLRDAHILIEPQEEGRLSILAEGSTFGSEKIDWSSYILIKERSVETKNTVTPRQLDTLLKFLEQHKFIKSGNEIPLAIAKLQTPILLFHTNSSPGKPLTGRFELMASKPKYTLNGEFKSASGGDTILGTLYSPPSKIAISANSHFNVATAGDFTISDINTLPIIDWSANIQVEDGLIDFGSLPLKNIAGNFRYSSGSENNKNSLSIKLPLKSNTPYKAWINIDPNSASILALKNFHLSIYGGHIKTTIPLVKNGKIIRKNELSISDISLAQFFYDAGLRNIRVSGKIGGIVPIDITSNDRIVTNGTILQSLDRGIIQLPDSMINGLFPGTSQKTFKIRQALKNYHYEYFEIRLDGDLNGRAMITINANGYNPDMYDKEPVEINLQIETQISELFKKIIRN